MSNCVIAMFSVSQQRTNCSLGCCPLVLLVENPRIMIIPQFPIDNHIHNAFKQVVRGLEIIVFNHSSGGGAATLRWMIFVVVLALNLRRNPRNNFGSVTVYPRSLLLILLHSLCETLLVMARA